MRKVKRTKRIFSARKVNEVERIFNKVAKRIHKDKQEKLPLLAINSWEINKNVKYFHAFFLSFFY